MTFRQAGALGLSLAESRRCGAVEVLSVQAGTQAVQHPELRPGLLVAAVGEREVSSLGYEEVFHLMGCSCARPLTVRFATSLSRLLEVRLAESASELHACRLEVDRAASSAAAAELKLSNNTVIAAERAERLEPEPQPEELGA